MDIALQHIDAQSGVCPIFSLNDVLETFLIDIC